MTWFNDNPQKCSGPVYVKLASYSHIKVTTLSVDNSLMSLMQFQTSLDLTSVEVSARSAALLSDKIFKLRFSGFNDIIFLTQISIA